MSKAPNFRRRLYRPWQAIGIFVFAALALSTIEFAQFWAANPDLDTVRKYHHIDSIVVFGLASVFIGLNKPHIYRMSRWAVKWKDVALGIILGLSARLLLQLMFRVRGEAIPAPDRHALAIVSIVLLGPILEELICRGALLRSLLANFHPLFAILLTTCIVAAFHAEFFWALPGQLILSVLYVVSNKSLPSTIICHITMNALTYVWYN
jgi:membrane protease YdiL (CAAX protease family)